MSARLILQLLSQIYSMVIRDVLTKAVNNPNSEWDDILLETIDRLFDYNTKNVNKPINPIFDANKKYDS